MSARSSATSDMTWTLAAAPGWPADRMRAGRAHGAHVQTACLLAAPLAPASLGVWRRTRGPGARHHLDGRVAGVIGEQRVMETMGAARRMAPTDCGWALALALAATVLVGREIGFHLATVRDTGANQLLGRCSQRRK